MSDERFYMFACNVRHILGHPLLIEECRKLSGALGVRLDRSSAQVLGAQVSREALDVDGDVAEGGRVW